MRRLSAYHYRDRSGNECFIGNVEKLQLNSRVMKRVLFIDRDGTLVVEPPVDKQVDSLEKLEFMPKVFQSLAYVATRLDFEWVMVTNQDGMGTSSFPAENFWTVQRKIIQAFANEGIRFDEVCIDSSFPEENLPDP